MSVMNRSIALGTSRARQTLIRSQVCSFSCQSKDQNQFVLRGSASDTKSLMGMTNNGTGGKRFFSSGHLNGKVALVTASTQGIGKAIAHRLVKDGAKVMISSRKENNVTEALKEIRQSVPEPSNIEGMTCHVGKAEDRELLVEETIKTFGGIDIFISNAGTNPSFGPILDCTEDQWDKIFDNNVKAAFLLTKMVVPHMLKKGEGNIVFISSIAGLQPIPMILPYSVSKTALLGLTKALSYDLAPQNIRVNSVAPGIIDTNFASALTSNEYVAEKSLELLHIKRFGQPDDIAGIVSFLCSKDAAYMTGENMVVGGGITSRL